MKPHPKHNWIEWGFVVLLVVLCAILTALQFRWTGEVSRAETERLRANLGTQAGQLCKTFDAELTASCAQLTPAGAELNERNREAAHVARLRTWKAGNHHPIFKRLAVAVPVGNEIQFFELDQKSERLARVAWPSEWADLRENLEGKIQGGSPPYEDPTGALFEFPIFGGRPDDNAPFEGGGPPNGGGGPGEKEWMIFELDTDYLKTSWLPELVRAYLNPADQPLNQVTVKTISTPGKIFYSTAASTNGGGEKAISIPFNRQGHDPGSQRAPGTGFRWTLEVRPEFGALEKLVAASRRRNLAVAFLLNGLILAAGVALVHHTRRSRQLAEAQMNFVASVSHELRTPLTVIRGAAHNLKRGVVHERSQIEQYSGLIIQHAEQLGEMVEQVLELAGAKKNKSAALRQPVAVADVLKEAVAATAQDTQAAHCEVHLELPPSLPTVSGDASALRRVFQNLITNAAKHGGGGGWIGITAVGDEDGDEPAVEIQIADRGPGIPQNELPQIFKPFFRGALAQTSQIRGSGLGLSLVREIVEAHAGSISVRSANGSGTTFTVRLPAATGKTK